MDQTIINNKQDDGVMCMKPHITWNLNANRNYRDVIKKKQIKKPRVYELKIPSEYIAAFAVNKKILLSCSRIKKGRNGMQTIMKNGLIYTYLSNKDIQIKFPGGVTGYKYAYDDTYEFADRNGTFYLFNNGQIEYKSKDRSIIQYPDGKYTILYKNGDFETHYRDGKFEKSISGECSNGYEYVE